MTSVEKDKRIETSVTIPQAEEFNILIPEGEYDAVCCKTEAALSFGGARKIFIKFRIHDGKHDGTELFMACNYPRGKIKPRLKYYQQWMLATGRRPNKREKLAPKVFPRRMYKVLVRDTKPKFANGKPKPDIFRYSVVDTIIEAQTGVR
ncbi:MAG: hypothetical protein GY839_12375 [candidate division Zixibacteria bacterium]|nr:hypothetical protein [candidate division Zixibacteria bacterium]